MKDRQESFNVAKHPESALTTDTGGGTSIAQLYTLEISGLGRCASVHRCQVFFVDVNKCRRCMDVMRTLTAKYADGYEVWARQMGEEPVVK